MGQRALSHSGAPPVPQQRGRHYPSLNELATCLISTAGRCWANVKRRKMKGRWPFKQLQYLWTQIFTCIGYGTPNKKSPTLITNLHWDRGKNCSPIIHNEPVLFPTSEINSCIQTAELMRTSLQSLSLAIKQHYPLLLSLNFMKYLVFVGKRI